MSMDVDSLTDAAAVLERAGAYLRAEPVLHNLVLGLLHARAASGEAGRYWTVADGDEVVGVVFQSPAGFPATLTPMPAEAVAAVVPAVDVALPGVHGEAATAACFAGQWTEVHRTAAFPVDGMRIYELHQVVPPVDVPGRLRPAGDVDRGLLVEWVDAFNLEVGQPADIDAATFVDTRLAAGHLWVWDDDGVVSMAARTEAVEGVVRVQAVYTPPARRGAGYAGACVAGLSTRLSAEGMGAMLYTDLGNPTSNAVYRRIGYRAVAECLRYRFA